MTSCIADFSAPILIKSKYQKFLDSTLDDSEKLADYFLEIASWQRLEILVHLSQESLTPSKLAKALDATNQEVHRNLERLKKSNLILKNSEGVYELTSLGQMFLIQTRSVLFMTNNTKYFLTHGFDKIPPEFIQRIGALESSKHIKGFVKVQETWMSIYQKAEKFLFNILFDVPYTQEIFQTIFDNLEKGIQIKSIFSESSLIPKKRQDLLKKIKFKDIPKHKNFERKMNKNITAIVVLNEKEASVCFPLISGEVDVSQLFYSDVEDFTKWCFDYFEDTWNNSTTFSESKIK